jgi:hypothetical protein
MKKLLITGLVLASLATTLTAEDNKYHANSVADGIMKESSGEYIKPTPEEDIQQETKQEPYKDVMDEVYGYKHDKDED